MLPAHYALLILMAMSWPIRATDADAIAHKASVVLRSDWDAAPNWAFFQRDEFQRDGHPASKTHLVVIIDGSDYYMPVAIDDRRSRRNLCDRSAHACRPAVGTARLATAFITNVVDERW